MKAALVLAMVLLTGCAHQTAQRQEQQANLQATVPTCSTDRECELKWSAARTWVLQNAAAKLQHLTPDFMETYNPPNTAASAIRVVKEPTTTPGRYRIVIAIGCRNPFGCIPDPMAMAQHFNNYVNAVPVPQASPAVAPVATPAAAPTTGPRPAPDWCKTDNVLWLGDSCVERKQTTK